MEKNLSEKNIFEQKISDFFWSELENFRARSVASSSRSIEQDPIAPKIYFLGLKKTEIFRVFPSFSGVPS